MERLSFDSGVRYDGLEAAIHVARYLLAKPYCEGRRVLDIACGEGYGSRLLKNWGASSVLGVDVSREAIDHAQAHFSGEGVKFAQSPAEALAEVVGDERFDLIVSLETIEHLQDPKIYLTHLRNVLAPGGCIIISCPNDWWYFPEHDRKNPFHIRKYHFEEFRKLTEEVLGKPSSWLLGAPAFGFINTFRGRVPEVRDSDSQIRMVETQTLDIAHLLPAEAGAGPKDANASYFVGIWGVGDEEHRQTGAMLPLSMDAFNKGIFKGHLSSEVEGLRAEVAALRSMPQTHAPTPEQGGPTSGNSELQAQVRQLGLLRRAALSENELMRETLHHLRMEFNSLEHDNSQLQLQAEKLQRQLDSERQAWEAERHVLHIGYHRYVRLRSMMPVGLMRTIRNLVKGSPR